MQRWQQRLLAIIIVLLVIVLGFDVSLYHAIQYEPSELAVNYRNIKDDKIPTSMNDVSILYFTDLQYGKFEDKERCDHVFAKIKELNPDILIFGGDVLDTNTTFDTKTQKYIQKKFKEIQAPLGKFAVWGEKDQSHKTELKKIYKKAQVEVLDNRQVSLYNGSSSGIRLIGLSSTSGISSATQKLSSQTFNLLVCHEPDILVDSSLASKHISLAWAGHSHGTQITFPLIGPYKTVSGASKLNRSHSTDLSFDYDISTGVGCTNLDVRYGAKPEINYYILKK